MHPPNLRHEALRYRGLDDLIEQTAPFVAAGVAGGDPVLVLERPEVNAALRAELGSDARRVTFADMTTIGRNPARIIPVWDDFIRRHGSRPIRGIGEPLWPGRSPAEAVECHVHEALINSMFAEQPAWILCPYDTGALDAIDVERMQHTHPVVVEAGRSPSYNGFDHEIDLRDLLASELPEPVGVGPAVTFTVDDLAAVRWAAEVHAATIGLPPSRCADVALVVSELATNSIRHGGGRGKLRSWTEGDRVVHEISDTGLVTDPRVGRRLPADTDPGGRGLWLVNQLCDLVQLRTSAAGTTIRVAVGPLN